MNRDVISYSVILAFSIFFMAMTWTIGRAEGSLLTSSIFPRVVLGGLILFSSYGLAKTFPAKGVTLQKVGTPAYVLFGLMLLLCTLFTTVGFLVAASVFLFLAGLYISGDCSKKSVIIMAVFSALATFSVYYVFTKILVFILP